MAQYSHTRLSTFEQCPLKYKFQYLDRLDGEEGEGIETFLGSRVHESLEQLYRDAQMGRVLSEEELLKDFSERWKREWTDAVQISNPRLTKAHYVAVGEKALSRYHRRHRPFDGDQTLGIEERVTLSLDGKGGYRLVGYVDRLAQEGEGRYAIHDYKTSKSLPLQAELDGSRQLALYQIAVQERFPDAKRVRLVWHYVAFDKILESERSPKALEALRRDTMWLIDRIEAEKAFEPVETALCGWCPYQALCPLKSHAARVEALPAKEFQKDDGVALVNQLAKVQAEAKRVWEAAKEKAAPLEAEVEALKEALIAYAKKHKLQAVRGSGAEARITEKTTWKFPGKNDEGRKELEDYLKKAGVWEEFSTLDANALAAAMEETLKMREQLSKFGSPIKEERVAMRAIERGV